MSNLSLERAQVGHWYRVAATPTSNPRLLSLGFLPMEDVCVRKKTKRRSGVLIVQVGNAMFGLRTDEARHIFIDAVDRTDVQHGV